MAMRNPPVSDVLRRRLFMTASPYTRRDAAGIMASSSPLMEAVMRQGQQNPLLQLTGGRNTSRGGSVSPSMSTSIPTMPDESDPQGSAGGDILTPSAPAPSTPDVVGNITPAPAPAPAPSTRKDVTGTVTPPKSRPVSTENLNQTSLEEAMRKLIGNKSTEDFIKENRDLLEKYAPIPEKKNLRKQYLTKFFLDMAARGAQGDAPLEAAATAAPGTFDEYLAAEEKQKERMAERDLLTVSMGLQDKKAQDASAQAINLKLLELAADQPEKMKQVRALMDMGLSESEALARVFPDSQLGATAMQMQAFEEMGHSKSIAALMLNAQLLKDATDNPAFFLNYLMNPKFASNTEDAKFLMAQAENAGAKMPDILAALAVAGKTLDPQGNVIDLDT